MFSSFPVLVWQFSQVWWATDPSHSTSSFYFRVKLGPKGEKDRNWIGILFHIENVGESFYATELMILRFLVASHIFWDIIKILFSISNFEISTKLLSILPMPLASEAGSRDILNAVQSHSMDFSGPGTFLFATVPDFNECGCRCCMIECFPGLQWKIATTGHYDYKYYSSILFRETM